MLNLPAEDSFFSKAETVRRLMAEPAFALATEYGIRKELSRLGDEEREYPTSGYIKIDETTGRALYSLFIADAVKLPVLCALCGSFEGAAWDTSGFPEWLTGREVCFRTPLCGPCAHSARAAIRRYPPNQRYSEAAYIDALHSVTKAAAFKRRVELWAPRFKAARFDPRRPMEAA